MAQTGREVSIRFSQPVRQVAMMSVVLVAFGAGAYIAYPRVAPVFLSNPYLNGFILFVFFIGLIACLYQVAELMRAVSWIEAFARDTSADTERAPSRLLAPLATLLRSRGAQATISSSSARSILDSVATRIEEARDITRYLANLLIFLGLLGTFYGLATTVPGVVDTIRSLAPSQGEGGTEVFSKLMTGLQGQLGGMGTAFASSLLGLCGSLIIGLLELFAQHGQNRFYRELEEWLSTITRLGFGGADDSASADSALLAAFAEHIAAQMDTLHTLFSSSDESRAHVDGQLSALASSVERLTGRLAAARDPAPALDRIADGQERLIELLQEQTQQQAKQVARAEAAAQEGGPHVDAESRMRLRSIDVQLLRILEEMAAGRQESLAELRSDLASLTKAIRQASGQPIPVPPAQARRG